VPNFIGGADRGSGFQIPSTDAHQNFGIGNEEGGGVGIDYRGEEVLAAWEFLPNLRWTLIVKADREEVFASVYNLQHFFLRAGGITFIVVILAAFLVSGNITRPIIALTQVADRIAEGDLETTATIRATNEIGHLAQSINTMAHNLKSLVGKVRISGKEVLKNAENIDKVAQQHQAAAQNTQNTSLQISTTAQKIFSTSQELTKRMEEVSQVAQQTALRAESGLEGIQTIDSSMQALTESNTMVCNQLELIQSKADAISSIILTMTKVADQTNLLSLNARIEAKKAGEYGKGFSVVAREIQRLADQTAVGTLEIERTIHQMLEAVAAGVQSVDTLSSTLQSSIRDISTVSNYFTQAIQQVQGLPPRFEMILERMQQQAQGAGTIHASISQLAHSAQQTAAALQNTQNTLALLRSTASTLGTEISRFQ